MTGARPTFDDLVARAVSLVRPGRRALLGIAGSPGAGKTTLAERLVRRLDEDGPFRVAHVPMDGFHLADAELDRLGRRDRKGAPDTFDAAGYAALLRRLREDEDDLVYAPGFERVLEQPLAGALPVPRAARLIVTEGNYLLLRDDAWARARAQLDEVWFCEPDEADRVRRLVARHEEFGKDREAAVAWALGTDQRNADLVAATRDRADLVVGAAVVGSTVCTEEAVVGPEVGNAAVAEAVTGPAGFPRSRTSRHN
jgi:pantothenate kinase